MVASVFVITNVTLPASAVMDERRMNILVELVDPRSTATTSEVRAGGKADVAEPCPGRTAIVLQPPGVTPMLPELHAASRYNATPSPAYALARMVFPSFGRA